MAHSQNALGKGIRRLGCIVGSYLAYALVPRWYYRWRRRVLMDSLTDEERSQVQRRADYYNRLSAPRPLSGGTTVGRYRFPYRKKPFEGRRRRLTQYFYDLYEVVRCFPSHLRFAYMPGDVTRVPPQPTFVKSRPVSGDNANAVLLKLNKRRHYALEHDPVPFARKRDMLVARTTWANPSPARRRLYEQFCGHPLCDVGKTRLEGADDPLLHTVKPFLTKQQQFAYKFIACIEGVDVATNLKWVMASNSIAVSPPMRYETWFMEGTLIPDYHFIEVKPDYSDLIDKMNYYIAHPKEAEAIVRHAHEYVAQFLDCRLERATQLAVAEKYFEMTNQPLAAYE